MSSSNALVGGDVFQCAVSAPKVVVGGTFAVGLPRCKFAFSPFLCMVSFSASKSPESLIGRCKAVSDSEL